MTVNKVSLASTDQSPQFIEDQFPLFNKFLEYYYKSQEKTGLGQNTVKENILFTQTYTFLIIVMEVLSGFMTH